jgi:dipeptidyl aminopeptidase/acylaminoacyl peptidase
MKIALLPSALALAVTATFTAAAIAQTPAPKAVASQQRRLPLPDTVEMRPVTIWSDGTRMAAHLYLPKNLDLKAGNARRLPAIVLCAGTGGTKEQTGGRLGPILVEHGYIALAFDYRGWGESDSRLMSAESQPKPDAQQEMTIKVKALRGQMSYAEQTEDIRAAISYIAGEPGVDAERIGLWGTSYGGGLVVWTTGNDPRVKCVAAQVPGMGAGNNPSAVKNAYDLAKKQARGETEPVPIETGKLTGALARYTAMRRNPVKSLGFNTLEAAAKISAPSLFVVAENDELTGNDVVERVQQDLVKRGVPSAYHVIKGITHYGVYAEAFDEATRVEVEWFDKYLKK